MRNRLILSIGALMILALQAHAQKQPAQQPEQMHRVYSICVQEFNDDQQEMAELNRMIEEEVGQMQTRGIGALIFNSYRTLVSGKVSSAMTSIVDMGITAISNSLRSHKNDWMKAVESESRFTKVLRMNEDISDFYMEPSNEGALDLTGIAFRGFSCSQHIKGSSSGNGLEVFNVEFQLDTTREGIQRMLRHSKFQMKLKSLSFNPYLCDVPNDSLSSDKDRIKFDFNKRKDLTLKLHTKVKSSWINEAMLITEDQLLGEFVLEVKIDPEMLKDSCFTFDINNPEDKAKLKYISLKGESFMVPRSYIGKIEGNRYWGTGQYKLEMTLSESCRINHQAYQDNKAWREEWKIIKKREKARKQTAQSWKKTMDKITMSWTNGQWVTEIISPCTKILLQEGTTLLNESMSLNAQSQPAGQSQSQPSGSPAGQPQGTGQGQGQKAGK